MNPDHNIDELPKQQLDINDAPQVDFEDHYVSNRLVTEELEKNQKLFANDSFIELIKQDAHAEEEKKNQHKESHRSTT